MTEPQTTKGRGESRYRQEATASRTGSSPPRVRDGKRVEHTAPSPNQESTLASRAWTDAEIYQAYLFGQEDSENGSHWGRTLFINRMLKERELKRDA